MSIFQHALLIVGYVAIGVFVRQMEYKIGLVAKLQTAKVVFHHQRLRNLVVTFLNVLHTVGRAEIGQVVLQMVTKYELAIKIQIVKAG